jgi:hypothetical protein
MSSKRAEVRTLIKDYQNNYMLVKHKNDELEINNEDDIRINENPGKMYSPTYLYKKIGTKKLSLTPSGDNYRVASLAAPFLESILIQEKDNKNKNNDHLRIKDIHNYFAIKYRLISGSLIIGFPIFFLFRLSKLKSTSLIKYIFLIPSFVVFNSVNEAIKNYITRKNAIFMLYCLDKKYLEADPWNQAIHEKYKEFMKANKMEFKLINNINI